jgi:hypothetical protein
LKGVSGVKSINQLQALVWGGRLESIQLPSPGADFAVVRFLTPEACDKYFKATENGIEIRGDKKSVVFVEKQPGPTSINDVMRNCIDGDASRCVRALDADEEWSDMLLMRLARGKGNVKRDVDRIKRGKTARGVSLLKPSDSSKHFRSNTLTSASTSSSVSAPSTMLSTSSANSTMTSTGKPAQSATPPTPARLLGAFTTRTKTRRVLASSPRAGLLRILPVVDCRAPITGKELGRC